MSALTIPIHYFYWTLSSSYPPKPSNQRYWKTTTNTYSFLRLLWQIFQCEISVGV